MIALATTHLAVAPAARPREDETRVVPLRRVHARQRSSMLATAASVTIAMPTTASGTSVEFMSADIDVQGPCTIVPGRAVAREGRREGGISMR